MNKRRHFCCHKALIPTFRTTSGKDRCSPDVQNATFGWTPLHYCGHSGNCDLWELLIARGASGTVLDWQGKRPSKVGHKQSASSNDKPSLSIITQKESPEPPNDSSALTPTAKRSVSSMLESKEGARHRGVRKGSPPLVPRLKLSQDKKTVHSSFDSALNKSGGQTNVTKSQDLTFSFRDNYGKRSALEKWLRRYSLEMLTDVLIESGYDDLDQILAQAQRLPISVEQLHGIGVNRRGHALRLLSALELELQTPDKKLMRDIKEESWECCKSPDSTPGLSAFPSLQLWLRGLGLEGLYEKFVAAGFEDLEPLLLVMKTSYALTEETLEKDFGIEKPGHRHRLLSKLKEDSQLFDPLNTDLSHSSGRSGLRLERIERTASCELCALM